MQAILKYLFLSFYLLTLNGQRYWLDILVAHQAYHVYSIKVLQDGSYRLPASLILVLHVVKAEYYGCYDILKLLRLLGVATTHFYARV